METKQLFQQKEAKKRRDRGGLGECIKETRIIDSFLHSVALIEIISEESSFMSAITNVFLSGLVVWSFKECLTKEELTVCWGVMHWVLRRSIRSKEIFWALTLRNKKMIFTVAARPIVVYGVKALYGLVYNRHFFKSFCASVVLLGITAGTEVGLCVWTDSVNIRRKYFHLITFIFFGFFPIEIIRLYSIGILSLFSVITRAKYLFGEWRISHRAIEILSNEKKLFNHFVSIKDKRGVVSHVLLLCGCFFSAEVLQEEKKRKLFVLSSVCILDAVSSLFSGKTHAKQRHYKSFQGSILGALTTAVVMGLLNVHYPLRYYIGLGITEYLSKMNDNISLPFVAYVLSG